MTSALEWPVTASLGVTGVIVGSFLDTVIERELSDVSTFRARLHCSAPMPGRSALVAALTGTVWVLVGLWSVSADVSGVSPLLPTVLLINLDQRRGGFRLAGTSRWPRWPHA